MESFLDEADRQLKRGIDSGGDSVVAHRRFATKWSGVVLR